ncbi:MAG: stage II sporulation protein D [Bacteroidota bacterium]
MRRTVLMVLAICLFLVIILPALLVRGCAPRQSKAAGLKVNLYVCQARKVIRLDLEDYLVGVVAAEMPAHFSLEALKAQAVAARTLTLRHLRQFGGRGCSHLARADLCDQPGDGQAWLSDAELRRRWGWSYVRLRARVRRAVQETKGLVLLYEHKPIDACYHSTCGGATEDAKSVWGRHIPYLVSVACGYDTLSPRFRTQVRMSRQELSRRLGQNLPAAAPFGLQILGRTPGGRVTTLNLGGKTWTGAAFRAAAGLRSANFTWQVEGGEVIFSVRGYGHGVGLCQYGAEGMARQDAGFLKILTHYYRGVTLGRIKA